MDSYSIRNIQERVGRPESTRIWLEGGSAVPSGAHGQPRSVSGRHTGYYAVVNHILTGDDPNEFPEMTLRQIPIPSASADSKAHLSWDSALEDGGEGAASNIIGYTVNRSEDGITFSTVNSNLVEDTEFSDDIPNDGEYYYAIGLVFRGEPPVTSDVLSANSARVFKDSDTDSLPDYYELANGLDETSETGSDGPSGDADDDTMSNYEEFIAGTRSNDKDSYFFAKDILPDGNQIRIRWHGVAGRSYSIFRATSLSLNDWARIRGPISCPSNQLMQYSHEPDHNTGAYYYLEVEKD